MSENLQDVVCMKCKAEHTVGLNGAKPYNKTTKPFICADCILKPIKDEELFPEFGYGESY